MRVLVPSGKFRSSIKFGGKQRYIGTFDTPEQASAVYVSVKKDLEDTNLSALSGDDLSAAFGAAKTKALKTVGLVPSKRKPKATSERGVRKKPSGKCSSMINWGGRDRYIGTFDTPEQASAAYISVRKDRDDVNLLAIGADEVDALFDAAKSKALESVGGSFTRKLPRGVYKLQSVNFGSSIWWGGKQRYIGTFDTPNQASAAYMSVMQDLSLADLSAVSAEGVDAAFDSAKKKAVAAHSEDEDKSEH